MGAVDPRIAQPTKRRASSSSRVNAFDDKSSTIMTPIITASVERRLDGKEDHEAPHDPTQPARWWKIPGYAPRLPSVRTAVVPRKKLHGRDELKAKRGRSMKRPELPEESAIQIPRAIGSEGRAVLPIPNATPDRGLGRRDDSTVVYPLPIDRSFDVLDSQKPESGRACLDHPSDPHGADERKEAASAQAVKRGHRVTMVEIPDQDDDVAYRRWSKRESPTLDPKRKSAELPTSPDFPKTTGPPPNEGVGPTCVRKNEVTSPTVSRASHGRCEGSRGPSSMV